MTKSRGIRVKRGTRALWVQENQGRHYCQCGCGEPVTLRPEHFNIGIPKYLHGHNAKANPPRKKEAPPAVLCECGCGSLATPGRRFISGHNGRGKKRSPETRAKIAAAMVGNDNHLARPRKPAPPQAQCECGCGELASPGRRFITGHNVAGQRLSNYTGVMIAGGYRWLHRPDHPLADKRDGWVREHRLVAEQHLRDTDPASPYLVEVDGHPCLSREFVVHHINGDKLDNRPENLAVMTSSEHVALHHAQGDIRGY